MYHCLNMLVKDINHLYCILSEPRDTMEGQKEANTGVSKENTSMEAYLAITISIQKMQNYSLLHIMHILMNITGLGMYKSFLIIPIYLVII